MTEEPGRLWSPEPIRLRADVAEVINAYTVVLEVGYPEHHRAFKLRLASDPDAARAEAGVNRRPGLWWHLFERDHDWRASRKHYARLAE